MSAYITMLTPMTDEGCLLAALADLGFGQQEIEVHATPARLVGYRGDPRTQVAHVIVRRQHLGSSSNDMGFLSTPTGYRAIVSDFDRGRLGDAWLAKLTHGYQRHWEAKRQRIAAEERRRLEAERQRVVEAQRKALHDRAKQLGYRVQETREGESIRLTLIRRSY
ncbi:MAG: DUF1257 domain-containing protein [Myxococcales bacterium]|nr:DUF1257 domain-containing protein [Myxococcales bacterium]